MRFSELFDSFIHDSLKADKEVKSAIDTFMCVIPGRVKQMEFDASRSNKQGVRNGDKVYKLGLDLEAGVALIEYLENYNQGQPTMALYVDRKNNSLTVSGRHVHESILIRYTVYDGRVVKTIG